MKPSQFTFLAAASVISFTVIGGCSTPGVSSNQTAAPQISTQEPSSEANQTASLKTSPKSSTQPVVYVDNGIAIRGADPVAYFEQGGFVQGVSEYSYEWDGATWHFASADNRDLFISNPKQYAPQYGGYCAWAVSQGYTAPVDPTAWKIVDGKLYLNYNQNVQRRWQRDIPGNIAKANQNWPGVLNN